MNVALTSAPFQRNLQTLSRLCSLHFLPTCGQFESHAGANFARLKNYTYAKVRVQICVAVCACCDVCFCLPQKVQRRDSERQARGAL